MTMALFSINCLVSANPTVLTFLPIFGLILLSAFIILAYFLFRSRSKAWRYKHGQMQEDSKK